MYQKRKANKIPNAQLAAWIGVVPSSIQTWRSGKAPTTPTINRISALLNIEPSILLMARMKNEFIMTLTQLYCDAKEPCKEITGRSFFDEKAPGYQKLQRRPWEAKNAD